MTLDELVRRHLAQLLQLERSSVKNLLAVYREQVKILTGELALLPEDRFSYQHLSKVLAQLKAGVDLMEAKVQDQLIIDQVKVHELSLKHGADELALGEKIAQEAGAPAPIVDRIQQMFAPLVNSPALKAFREATKLSTKLWAANELTTIKSVVMSGLIRSSHPRKIADDLRKRLTDDRTEYQIQRIAQTEFWNGANTAHRVANEAITEKYPELGYEHDWEAILDNKTCGICQGLDKLDPVPVGKPFILDGKEYFQPTAHPLCRCRLKVTCERWRRREEAAKKKAAEAKQDAFGSETIPAGTPVSNAINLKASVSSPVHGSVTRTMEAIDGIHGDGVLPKIPVKARKLKGAYGHYDPRPATFEIAVNPDGDHQELTFAHELGHFMDHHGFAGHGYSSDSSPMFDEFRQATRGSSAYKAMKDVRAKGYTEFKRPDGSIDKFPVSPKTMDYFLSDREVWARAYSQYVAVKSNDPALLSQVAALREPTNPDSWRQWADDDFLSIGMAIERLLEAMGWLKRK